MKLGFWTQQDAPQLVRDSLRRGGLDYERVRAELPENWQKTKPTVITATEGGTPDARRGVTGELVEVRVHAIDRFTARQAAQAVDSFLTTPLKAGWHFQCKPATGLLVMPDSKLGGYIALLIYTITTHRGRE